MTYRYRLGFEPDDKGTSLSTSPDFPPLATFGDDETDALRYALDALLTLIRSMIDANEPVPTPAGTQASNFAALPLLASLKIELHNAMLDSGLTRDALQRRLGRPDGAVDRLLQLSHESRVRDVEAAFRSLGRELSIETKANALSA